MSCLHGKSFRNSFYNKEMINLKEVTFIIPIKIDSEDRLNNYKMIINHLTTLFDTNIIVCESDKESHESVLSIHDDIEYMFVKSDSEFFHRTKLLNLMTKKAGTNIVCNYDTDVLFPEIQYILAVNKIKEGCTLVFPYGGKFMDVPKRLFPLLRDNKFDEIYESDMDLAHPSSLGGAFFFDKIKYSEAGLENENFMSWGFEDNERISRLRKLNHTVCRTGGLLFHLNHERTINSVPEHPFYNQNMLEYNKINSLSKTQLEGYIKTWNWV
jgi:hypothetical protein